MGCSKKSCRRKIDWRLMMALVPALLMLVYGSAGAVGVTHNVYGKLAGSDGSVPGDGDVQFTAYISSRPQEIITYPGAVGSGYKEGWWIINVGNFPSAWKEGEVLVIEFADVSDGEEALVRVTLTAHQEGEVLVNLQRAQ